MSEEEILYEGSISRDYRRKELFKTWSILTIKDFIICFGVFIIFIVTTYVITNSKSEYDIMEALETRENLINFLPWLITIFIIFIDGLVLIINYVYLTAYLSNFSYRITNSSLTISYGVFEKRQITIPFNRIQNICIIQGVFDRLFKIYTFNIETAGGAGTVRKIYYYGHAIRIGFRPEGYIPGLKDPSILKNKISEMMTRYSQIPSGMEDKILKPEDLAFDNFTGNLLSRTLEANEIKSRLKEMREYKGLLQIELARRVNCSIEAILYLEEGSFSPSVVLAGRLAKVLNCKIKDIFELK